MKRKRVLSFILFSLLMLSVAGLQAADFSGSWDTNWGPVTIVQKGDRATGSYSGRFKGKLEGDVIQNRFNFRWFQPNGEWGRGYFILSADGGSFNGRWGGGESDSDGGAWNGRRK